MDARSMRIPVLAGPTAGGKTALSIELALRLRATGVEAEVICADSMQVYRGLDIGTAKPDRGEQQGIPHHLLDIREPTETYSVAAWFDDAERTIGEIRGRNALPIVVGGTHLFVKMLLDGMMRGAEPDPALRATLEAMDPTERRLELERVDPQASARIHPADTRRTIRALEVYRTTGRPISAMQTQWDHARTGRHARFLLVGLDWPVEALNARINARVRRMIDQGLVEEARALWASGRLGPTAREAIGYKQLIAHFEGHASLDEATEQIKIESRRLGKKQRTWLRRLRTIEGAVWIEAQSGDPGAWAERTLLALNA